MHNPDVTELTHYFMHNPDVTELTYYFMHNPDVTEMTYYFMHNVNPCYCELILVILRLGWKLFAEMLHLYGSCILQHPLIMFLF